MNMTKKKRKKELLAMLEEHAGVFLLGCDGCPIGAGTGGAEHLADLEAILTKAGKKIAGTLRVDFLCNKALVGVRLGRAIESVKAADCIVVSSCGVGVQATSAMVDLRCVPALDTISVNAHQGIWPSSERCGQCGECLLGYTGGICPVTTCSKSLVNGACGGTADGKCEVSKEKDCGWYLIFKRLNESGRLDDLRRYNEPRDFSKQDIPDSMRASIWWALEYSKEDAQA